MKVLFFLAVDSEYAQIKKFSIYRALRDLLQSKVKSVTQDGENVLSASRLTDSVVEDIKGNVIVSLLFSSNK